MIFHDFHDFYDHGVARAAVRARVVAGHVFRVDAGQVHDAHEGVVRAVGLPDDQVARNLFFRPASLLLFFLVPNPYPFPLKTGEKMC